MSVSPPHREAIMESSSVPAALNELRRRVNGKAHGFVWHAASIHDLVTPADDARSNSRRACATRSTAINRISTASGTAIGLYQDPSSSTMAAQMVCQAVGRQAHDTPIRLRNLCFKSSSAFSLHHRIKTFRDSGITHLYCRASG